MSTISIPVELVRKFAPISTYFASFIDGPFSDKIVDGQEQVTFSIPNMGEHVVQKYFDVLLNLDVTSVSTPSSTPSTLPSGVDFIKQVLTEKTVIYGNNDTDEEETKTIDITPITEKLHDEVNVIENMEEITPIKLGSSDYVSSMMFNQITAFLGINEGLVKHGEIPDITKLEDLIVLIDEESIDDFNKGLQILSHRILPNIINDWAILIPALPFEYQKQFITWWSKVQLHGEKMRDALETFPRFFYPIYNTNLINTIVNYIPMCPTSLDEFKRRLFAYVDCHNFIYERVMNVLELGHALLAGGSLISILFNQKRQKDGDLDIWVLKDKDSLDSTVKILTDGIDEKLYSLSISTSIINIKFTDITIQIIYSGYKTIEDLVSNFDMSYLEAFFNGTLYASPNAINSWVKKIFIVNRRAKTYRERIVKSMRRGFSLEINENLPYILNYKFHAIYTRCNAVEPCLNSFSYSRLHCRYNERDDVKYDEELTIENKTREVPHTNLKSVDCFVDGTIWNKTRFSISNRMFKTPILTFINRGPPHKSEGSDDNTNYDRFNILCEDNPDFYNKLLKHIKKLKGNTGIKSPNYHLFASDSDDNQRIIKATSRLEHKNIYYPKIERTAILGKGAIFRASAIVTIVFVQNGSNYVSYTIKAFEDMTELIRPAD